MASSVALLFDLIGRDGASPAFLRAGASAERAGTQAELAGKRISGFSKTLGLVGIAGVAVAIKAAVDFQSKMLLIQTQAGATAAEVKKMTPAILSLAGPTATAPEALATSLYHIWSTGMRGAQALDAVKIAAEGAKVGHADLEATTNALTAVMVSGIGGIANMSDAMGKLNTIVGAGDMSMTNLVEAFSGTGLLAAAQGFGVTFNQVGAALATFGDNGIRGADAATQLRMTMMALSAPAKGGAGQLKALGLSAAQLKSDLSSGGLTKALEDLNAHMVATGVKSNQVGEVLTTAFGKKAGVGITVLEEQLSRYQTKLADVQKGGTSFGASWQAWTQSNAGQIDLLKAHVQQFEVEFGTKLLPVLNDGVKFLNNNSTAVLAVIGGLVGLKLAIGTIKVAQEAYNAALVVGAGVQKLFGLSSSVSGAQVAVETASVEASTTALSAQRLAGLSATVQTSALGTAAATSATRTAGMSGAATVASKALGVAGLALAAEQAWSAFHHYADGVAHGNSVTSNFIKFLDSSNVATTFSNLWGMLNHSGSSADTAAAKIAAVGTSIRVLPSGKTITINTQYNSWGMDQFLAAYEHAASLPAISNKLPGAPQLPSVPGAHASGGYLDQGWNMVGEQGPEMVNSRTGRVLTASDTRRAMGSGGGGDVYITINAGLGADGPALGRHVAGALERYAGQGGKISIARSIR
jgi:TP901 family phage tail tape measure protein